MRVGDRSRTPDPKFSPSMHSYHNNIHRWDEGLQIHQFLTFQSRTSGGERHVTYSQGIVLRVNPMIIHVKHLHNTEKKNRKKITNVKYEKEQRIVGMKSKYENDEKISSK